MPIVTVSHKETASVRRLDELRRNLPVIVSRAMACAEEPYDGELRPGDINLVFLPGLSTDDGLDYLVEVRTRWTRERSKDLQERSEQITRALVALGLENFGVWIEIPQGGWSQA